MSLLKYPTLFEARYENFADHVQPRKIHEAKPPRILAVLCSYIPENKCAKYLTQLHIPFNGFEYRHDRFESFKFAVACHRHFKAGLPYDFIVIDNDSPDSNLTNYLESIQVPLICRENTYYSFGAYKAAWDWFKDDYDFFVFHEMDWVPSRHGWLKYIYDIWMSDPEIGMIGNLIEFRELSELLGVFENVVSEEFIQDSNATGSLHYNLDSEYLFTDSTILHLMDDVGWPLFRCLPEVAVSPSINELAFQQPLLEAGYKLRCFNDGKHTMFYGTYNRDLLPQWNNGLECLAPFVPEQVRLFIPEFQDYFSFYDHASHFSLVKEYAVSYINQVDRVDQVNTLDRMFEFFDPAWHSEIEKDYRHGRLFAVIAYGSDAENRTVPKSGCVVKIHDGIAILYYLYTHDPYVNHGLATMIVSRAAELARPHIILARYRNDELHIARLFSNAGYRIVHEGSDNFIIVAF